jgi:hypothetical protein
VAEKSQARGESQKKAERVAFKFKCGPRHLSDQGRAFLDEVQGAAWRLALEGIRRGDVDGCLRFPISGVKMRRQVVIEKNIRIKIP